MPPQHRKYKFATHTPIHWTNIQEEQGHNLTLMCKSGTICNRLLIRICQLTAFRQTGIFHAFRSTRIELQGCN